MKDAVCTLPITPKTDPKLGLVITPFVADMLAKHLSISMVLGQNLLGAKGSVLMDSAQYLESLAMLGICPDIVWRDIDDDYLVFVRNYIQREIEQEKIILAQEEVLMCDCALVEIFPESLTGFLSQKASLVKKIEEEPYCRVCRTKLRTSKKFVLYLKNVRFVNCNAQPDFYKNEIAQAIQNLSRRRVLISRQRKTGFEIEIDRDQRFSIDVDYVWSVFPLFLENRDVRPMYLVVSNHSIAPLARILFTCNLNGIDILVVPYFQINARETTMEMVARYGTNVVRIFLGEGLNWQRKEAQVDSKRIFWILKSMGNLRDFNEQEPSSDLWQFIKQISAVKVRECVENARKTKTAQRPFALIKGWEDEQTGK